MFEITRGRYMVTRPPVSFVVSTFTDGIVMLSPSSLSFIILFIQFTQHTIHRYSLYLFVFRLFLITPYLHNVKIYLPVLRGGGLPPFLCPEHP